MVTAAAAEIGLGDQAIDPRAELFPDCVEFGLIAGSLERVFVIREIVYLGHGEGNKPDVPRIAVVIGLAAGHRAGQPLFSVEPVPCGEDDVAFFVPMETGPKGLLDGLRTRRRPHHGIEPPSAGPGLRAFNQPLGGGCLDGCDRVVGIFIGTAVAYSSFAEVAAGFQPK